MLYSTSIYLFSSIVIVLASEQRLSSLIKSPLIEIISEKPETTNNETTSSTLVTTSGDRGVGNNVDHFFNIIFNFLNNRTFNLGDELINSQQPQQPSSSHQAAAGISSYMNMASNIYKNCSEKLRAECCTNRHYNNNLSFFVCYKCNASSSAECPCLCSNYKETPSSSPSFINPVFDGGDVLETIFGGGESSSEDIEGATASTNQSQFDMTFNFYTLMLSIGLPCLSVLMIVCTLASFAYCCKYRNMESSSNRDASQSSSSTANEIAGGNTNLSFIYLDMDRDDRRKYQDDPGPPKYNEIFQKSRQPADKLPTYKSFREKSKQLF